MPELIKNKKKSEILAEKIASLNYGDSISHIDISDTIHEDHRSCKYAAVIQQARKVLLKHYGKILESIRGYGYRVICPDDYVTQYMRHVKRGVEEFKKGDETLRKAPVAAMSEEGRDVYKRINDRNMILNASLRGTIVELKTLEEKRHPFLPAHVNT